MAIGEEQRHELYRGLEAVLGRERATTMMELLPPVGWSDVARRSDLDHLEAVLRRDMEILRTELKGELAAGLGEVRSRMQALEVEVGRSADRVLRTVEARINDALVSQTRWVVASVLTTFIAFAALVLGLGR